MERARSRNGHATRQSAPPAPGAAHATHRALSWAMMVAGLTTAGAVHAIGLDEIVQQSGLGEPLRLVIPVLSNATDSLASDEFAGECFKLVPPAAGDLPQLNSARVALEQRGGRAFVVLTTPYPMNEPVMRLAVQAGCRVSVSREYTVLLDPVTIAPPIAEVAKETPVAPAAAGAAAAQPAAVSPGVSVAAPQSDGSHRTAAPRKRAANIARNNQDNTVNRASRAASSPSPTTIARAAKSSPQPRLQVSRTVEDANAVPATGAAAKAAAERDALRAIEEQTVVLQRQIAELSVSMERMQRELVAARAAKAEAEKNARAAVEQAAAAASSPWAAMRAWAGVNWPLLVLIPAVLVLIAAALHRRRPVLVPAPITPAQAAAFNRADLGEPSVPGPEPLHDEEAVVTPLAARRAHVIPPAMVDPPPAPLPAAHEFKYDPELAFDFDVQQAAQESSAYSTLEREQPGIVGRLTDTWGTPKAAAQLENYLLTPRRGGRGLSGGAIEELKLLRSIALEHVGGPGFDMKVPMPHEGNGQLRASGS